MDWFITKPVFKRDHIYSEFDLSRNSKNFDDEVIRVSTKETWKIKLKAITGNKEVKRVSIIRLEAEKN